MKYLNIGSGNSKYDNVLNVDIWDGPGVDVVADMRKLPFDDDSIDGIVSEHSFEHIVRNDHEPTLMEFRRVLKNGCKLIIECPDIEKCIENYLCNYKGFKSYWYQTIYGMNRIPSDRHLSGIDKQYLTDLLFSCGFCSLEWAVFSERFSHNLRVEATKGDLPPERIS